MSADRQQSAPRQGRALTLGARRQRRAPGEHHAFTLRARLTLTVLALAGGAIVVMGVVTHETLESYLVGRVDQQMRVARVAALVALNAHSDVLELPASIRPTGGAVLPPGTYAELRHGDEVVDDVTFRYGLRKAATPRVDAADLRRSVASGELFTAGSEGDDRDAASPSYRAGAWKLRPGYTLVVAIPLTEVSATLHHTLVIEIVVGLGVLAALMVAAWFLIRRGLRPLDDMAEAAGAIAGGDLARRVEPAEPSTEVGRLGLALNAMLAQIERAFAAREASEQRLRRFLADASHELRTPLTSIRGYAELFRRGADERPEDLAVSMRRIEEEAQRMGVLVNDLLLLARLDDERQLQREPVDLAALVADCVQDARAAAPDRRIELTLLPVAVDGRLGDGLSEMTPTEPSPETTPSGPPAADGLCAPGDDDRLRQVVANLLANATRHTPAGTAVDVLLGVEDGQAVLRVRDHGPGLPPEKAEHVFEAFYRSATGRNREDGGAGLGLAIVKAIVDAHDGMVAVEETPGGGATFVVRLPLRDQGAAE